VEIRAQRALTMTGAILGSYRITGVLASGGMGQVFRAEHAVLGKLAAVKVLRAQFTHDDALVARFVTEAKAAAAIRHPGVIEIYDFGFTDEGNAYLAMELLDGESLGGRLKTRGRILEGEALTIARGIASALVAAHAKGIVHRDLKPDNVFLVADGAGGVRPKVLDFGIAKLVEDGAGQTQTGALLGTPLYMAPEQARAAKTIDARADLYSLGCMLYEMLVGNPPFTGDGAGELIAHHMFTEPARVAGVGADTAALVARLLAKEPDDRPQTAQAVVDALSTHSAVVTAVVPAVLAPAASGQMPRVIDVPAAPKKRDLRMPIVAGLVVALAIGVGAYAVSRGGSSTVEAAVIAPPPSPPPPAIVETKPVAPPPAIVEAPPAPPPPAIVEAKKPPVIAKPARTTKLKTTKGSPAELGQLPE
jgi:serine/threonine-protein kinase